MRTIRAHVGCVVLGVTVLGCTLLGGAAAAGASPSGGEVQVWVTPDLSGNGGSFMITGTIADYGTTINVTSTGKKDANGNYGLLTLKKGTITVNLTQLNKKSNSANPPFNKTNCSAHLTFSAPVALVKGTGAYVGITGTLTINTSFAFIGPKTSAGKCSQAQNAKPLSQYGSIQGSGMVSFS